MPNVSLYHAPFSRLGEADLDLDRIRDLWRFPGKYIVSAVVAVGVLHLFLIRYSSEYTLKRRMNIVGRTTRMVEGQGVLTELVLEKYGSVRFRLIDQPEDGYFPNDLDGIIDEVYWSKLCGAGGPKFKGMKRPWWASKPLFQEQDRKSYELATKKFLKGKEQYAHLDDTIR